MSNTPLLTPCIGNGTIQTRPPLALITNTAPSSNDDKKQNNYTQPPTEKLKTMKLRLPHPSSLDAPPSSTNKWSATTHPIKGLSFGHIGYHIFYKHFYFHHGRVLHTNAFAPAPQPPL